MQLGEPLRPRPIHRYSTAAYIHVWRNFTLTGACCLGRGAPEIDILEVMPGKGRVGATNFTLPYLSTSLQISPGVPRLRPKEGLFPDKSKHQVWYEDGLKYGANTSLNIFFYGVKLQSVPKSRSYQTYVPPSTVAYSCT